MTIRTPFDSWRCEYAIGNGYFCCFSMGSDGRCGLLDIKGLSYILIPLMQKDSCAQNQCDQAPRIPTPGMASPTCYKCSNTKKSGKRSCCAHGGTWFKNCGNAGDIEFDHTWAEGIKVCEGELLTGSLMLWIAVSILLVN